MLLRVQTVVFLLLLALSAPAVAQNWQYMARSQSAMLEDKSVVFYVARRDQWKMSFVIPKSAIIDDPTITFVQADGSWKTYSVDIDTILTKYHADFGYSISQFPISVGTLELLMGSTQVIYSVSQVEYPVSLKGSRAAISKLIEKVLLDQAAADDEQHSIAQAESDAQQARARAIKAIEECDRLVGYAWDPQFHGVGVLWADIDGPAAVAACEDALGHDTLDDDVKKRLTFQLGRAYDKVNDKRTLNTVKQAALKMGYAAALYHLALLYEEGNYTSKNLEQAKQALLIAHDQGSIPATYRLGKTLFEEATSSSQRLEAEALLKKCVDAEFPQALEYLANLILDGRTTSFSQSEGSRYLTAAAKAGQPNASYRLAKKYRDEGGSQANWLRYQSWLKIAARQGSAEAKKELAE